MAVTGLANGAVTTGYSYPVVALYNPNGGTPSYSGGMDLARGVSVDPSIETNGDNNVFYANNGAAEEAQQRFRRGTCAFTVDGLLRAAENLILGVNTTSTVTVGTASVTMHDNDDEQEIPYVGVGYVVRRQSAGVEFFQAVVYPKARFAQFAPSAATEEEDIDWQTTELSATLLRDDSAKHRWQRVSDPLETELEAYNTVRAALGLSAADRVPGNGAVAAG